MMIAKKQKTKNKKTQKIPNKRLKRTVLQSPSRQLHQRNFLQRRAKATTQTKKKSRSDREVGAAGSRRGTGRGELANPGANSNM